MNTYTPYSTCIHTPLEHPVQVTASVLRTGQATICVSGWLCMLKGIEAQMKDGLTTHFQTLFLFFPVKISFSHFRFTRFSSVTR